MTTERVRSNHGDDNDDDGYFDLDRLARYSSLSVCSLRRYLHRPVDPLPHLRLGQPGSTRGRVLVRKKEFDAWLQRSFGSGTRPPRDHGPRDPRDPSWMQRAFRK